MTGIGEKIIREVGQLTVIDNVAAPLIFGVTLLAWKANAEEQLEALVEQHIREMSAEDVMRIRWPEEKIPE